MANNDFDLVWIHFLNMIRYLRDPGVWERLQDVPIVLDQHNDVERVWQRIREDGGFLEGIYAKWNLARIRDLRSWSLPRCEVALSVSEEDALTTRELVDGDVPVWVVPNGVDVDRLESAPNVAKPKRVVFVGSMNVRMNVDAVSWFSEEVFSRVRREIPDAEFWIVGRDPTSSVRALQRREDVEVTGRVDDVVGYYEEAAVAVVPHRLGGGTKLKALEAMAARVPLVATSVGIQGLDVQRGVHLEVADEPGSFADAVVRLIRDRDRAEALTEAARRLVTERYSWTGLYEDAIRRLEERSGISGPESSWQGGRCRARDGLRDHGS